MKVSVARATSRSRSSPDVRIALCPRGADPAASFDAPLDQTIRTLAKTYSFHGKTAALSGWPIIGHTGLRHVVLVGVGTGQTASYRTAGACVARHLRHLPFRSIHVQFPDGANDPRAVECFLIGFHRGLYRMRAATRTPSVATSFRLFLQTSGPAVAIDSAIAAGCAIGSALNETADLANRAGNACTPAAVVGAARKLARRTGMRCMVWDARQLAREHCHAHLGVGIGSEHPPCLIRLDYRPRGARGAPVVFVGKTITFDSGGLSLKPAKSMESMKYDKSGGMAVLAAMDALARLRIPRAVTGFLAVAENMPDGRAQRPGDIVRTRKGLTVEVLNTDAEGRLVLADALDVACDLRPSALIDLATLTGAAVTALGKERSAIIGTDPALVRSLIEAGERTGEKLWELPRDEAYRSLLHTPAADLRNIGDGTAGTIIGGVFLEHFVDPAVSWAHVDLTHAWEERDRAHAPAGATLFGTHLLLDWLRSNP